ncbi:hypothetical protein ACWD5B_12185 [Streptomyces tanashiensis]
MIDSIGEHAEQLFTGVWEQRNWRNVPGPFYAGETDSMAMGRLDAPGHIAYDDDLGGGYGSEFIYLRGEVVPVLRRLHEAVPRTSWAWRWW